MYMIWTTSGPYRRAGYASEADLEAAIIEVQRDLFGANRIYLDKVQECCWDNEAKAKKKQSLYHGMS
jgi:hypothetical protein